MSTDTNLARLERKTYLRFHGDGIWDLFLGITLLWFGVCIWLDQAYLVGVIAAVLIPSVVQVKKSFARHRLGYVEFSLERQARERRGKVILVAINLIAVLLGLALFLAWQSDTEMRALARSLGMLPFGFVVAFLTAVAGAAYGINRFVYYGIVILAAFVAGHLMNLHPGWVFVPLGAVITLTGLIMRLRFMQKYPKQRPEETADVSG
jgi:hypothetical protein